MTPLFQMGGKCSDASIAQVTIGRGPVTGQNVMEKHMWHHR